MTAGRLSAAAALVGLHAAAAGSQPPTGIARAAWLQGCWASITPQRAIEEQWTAPRGTTMLGMGRTVRAGRLVDYELVVLRENGDRLDYEAHPAGQPAATFTSSAISDGRLVFSNPAHDFPDQVGYERRGAALLAWIEGTEGGTRRRIEFAYDRVPCAGSGP